MTKLKIIETIFETPEALENAPRLKAFQDHLVTRSGMTETEARGFIGTLVAAMVEKIGIEYAEGMRVHVEGVMSIRTQLRGKYNAVLEHFGKRGIVRELPPELQPEVFRDLYNQLADHIEAIKSPAEAVQAATNPAVADDLATAMREFDAPGPPKEPPGPPEEILTPDVAKTLGEPPLVEDKGPKPDLDLDDVDVREWLPGVAEQSRVERLRYMERLRARGEDPVARAAAGTAAIDFGLRYAIPPDWTLSVRRIPRFGSSEEQIRALGEIDPVFAATGYELVLRSPSGQAYAPDGVGQGTKGYVFLEYKDPLGATPSGYYSTEAGIESLRQTMIARAEMAGQLPGCGGWSYKTGQPWLDDLIFEIRDSLPPELADRILVPEAKGGQ